VEIIAFFISSSYFIPEYFMPQAAIAFSIARPVKGLTGYFQAFGTVYLAPSRKK